jgi:hypothetical protein
MTMEHFWLVRKEDLRKINARRAQLLAHKHFRNECPIGRIAARLGLALAVRYMLKGGC